jgi:XTP/dITP diphosphohydrolase
MRCVVATANPDKAAEIVAIMGHAIDLELVERPRAIADVEETGETLLDNARLKARALFAATGELTIADDTGLLVDALHGAPGVRSARFAGEHASYQDNVERLLEALTGAANRFARFETIAIAILPTGQELVATGTVLGVITERERGDYGFGYDPIFEPLESKGRTFAEMTSHEKSEISHRGRAFRHLAALIGEAVS